MQIGGPGPVNTNWGSGPVNTNWGLGPVNTNWGVGPGIGSGGHIQRSLQSKRMGSGNTNTLERKCWILIFKVGYIFLQDTLYMVNGSEKA